MTTTRPKRARRFRSFAEVDVGEHLEDDVHAAPVGHGEDAFRVVRVAMVEGVVHAEVAEEPHPVAAAGRCEDLQPGRPSELNGCRADAAAAAVDEDGFPGPRVAALEERAVRGAVGHAERGALGERHVLGQVVHLGGLADRHLGVAAEGAGDGAGDVDALARRESRHAGSGRRHDTGAVRARRVGKMGPPGVHALPDVGVHRVHPRRAQAHQDVIGTRGRVGDFAHAHHRRLAELVHDNRFHRVPPPSLEPRA